MRKSIDGLIVIIEGPFHMSSSDNALYLFCGKKCKRIKALFNYRIL